MLSLHVYLWNLPKNRPSLGKNPKNSTVALILMGCLQTVKLLSLSKYSKSIQP